MRYARWQQAKAVVRAIAGQHGRRVNIRDYNLALALAKGLAEIEINYQDDPLAELVRCYTCGATTHYTDNCPAVFADSL